MKLISMTDFVLEQSKELSELPNLAQMTKAYMNSYHYAQFIKQTLKLGMFVPCDGAGNVLEIKNFFGYGRDYILKTMSNEDLIKFDKYQQAKERILFKGFYSTDENTVSNGEIGIIFGGLTSLTVIGDNGHGGMSKNQMIVEDLVEYGLILARDL